MYVLLENIIIVIRPFMYILVLLSPVLFKKYLFQDEKNLGFVEEDEGGEGGEGEEGEEGEEEEEEDEEGEKDEEEEEDEDEEEDEGEGEEKGCGGGKVVGGESLNFFNISSINNTPQNIKEIIMSDILLNNIHFPIESKNSGNDVDISFSHNLSEKTLNHDISLDNLHQPKKTKTNMNWCCSLSTKEN